MSLSVSYLYHKTGQEDSITNEHQKNEIERLWDYAGTAAELKEMVKDKQYYSLVIKACNRANEFLASHLVRVLQKAWDIARYSKQQFM